MLDAFRAADSTGPDSSGVTSSHRSDSGGTILWRTPLRLWHLGAKTGHVGEKAGRSVTRRPKTEGMQTRQRAYRVISGSNPQVESFDLPLAYLEPSANSGGYLGDFKLSSKKTAEARRTDC